VARITIDDCEAVSKPLSEKMDITDPITQNYFLEVSSPGIDRVMKKQKDFDKNVGELVEIKLYKPIDGQKLFEGKLIGFENDKVKIEINGNAKYDLFATTPDPGIEIKMRQTLNLETSGRIIVAGSTRRGEEEMILDAFVKALGEFPDTILIIVPRHIDRTSEIGALINDRGLQYQLRTEIGEGKEKRTEKVIIINTFGELFTIYSVGTIVFCGASLVPLGGQNPLEPAAWGKAVLYGPSMEDFLDAKDLLERTRASIPVSTPVELGEKILWLLGHPEESMGFGNRAREAVLKNQGAAEKHARAIEELIKRN